MPLKFPKEILFSAPFYPFFFWIGNFTFEQSDLAPLAVPVRVICATSKYRALNGIL